MVAAKTCSSCKKLFDAKGIRNNLCEKCLATEVVRHWLKSDLEEEGHTRPRTAFILKESG